MKTNPNRILSQQDSMLRSSEKIFDGHILQLYVNQLEIEPGVIVDREIIHHQEAVCVLADIDDQVLMVSQYRPAITQTTLELPAGLIDQDEQTVEEALIAAKRELNEETGYEAEEWTYLHAMHPSPGFLDEKIHLFRAKDLRMSDRPLEQDEHENIELFRFSKAEVQDLLQKGRITDLKTLLGLTIWINEVND